MELQVEFFEVGWDILVIFRLLVAQAILTLKMISIEFSLNKQN